MICLVARIVPLGGLVLKIAISITEKEAWDRQNTQSRFRSLFNCSSWLSHFLYGVIAFSIFELLFGTLLKSLALSRRRGFFFIEFLIFALVSVVVYLYSRTYRMQGNRQGVLLRNDSKAFDNLNRLSEGITDSLSAIMFYARTNMVHEGNPQKIRDLREIMERIDQIQLLIQNMTALMTGNLPKPAIEESADLQHIIPKELEIREEVTTDESSAAFNNDTVKPYSFLRKSARKVLILPITVRMMKDEKNVEFQTYTINVCEEGACIIFVENVLSEKAVIDVQIAAQFESQARIKWVQFSGESSFRLAGIEFIESKLWMNAS
jgi:hypothetical protein